MLIETDDSLVDISFQHVQLEICGMCNMRCKHCRAWEEARVNLPLSVIDSVIDFALSEVDPNVFYVTVSGGEPFIRSDLPDVISLLAAKRVRDVVITTNGSLVTEHVLRRLVAIGIDRLVVQTSLDSPVAAEHDAFREYAGAFEKAIQTIRMVSSAGIFPSVRSTIRSGYIDKMESLVELARRHGAKRVGFGTVIPVGRGRVHDLSMCRDEKKKFIESVTRLKLAYANDVEITTEDPLKFALGRNDVWSFGDVDPSDLGVFGGCTAGISSFNVTSEGVITPCAVLPIPIMSVVSKNPESIKREYSASPVVRTLVGRSLGGACARCALKRVCGGCRAIALVTENDVMGCDSTCWCGG